MFAEKINMDTVCMVTHVTLDILMKFVVRKIVMYLIVRKDTPKCDFFCETQSEMELHIGRKHSDQLECGICNYEADNLENLTIHLATCEIYKCEDCELKVKTLNEVKNHVEKEHLTRIDFNFIYIMHIK